MNLIEKLFAPIDMTEGRPGKQIVAFTIPMLIGNIAQQLYNTVDSIIVGRYVGDNALAAVGSAGPLFNLFLILFVGVSVGAGIVVAQFFGAKQRKELSDAIGACLTITGVCVLFIMLVAPFITKPLLVMLNTPDTIIDWCYNYLLILFIGSAGLAYYNILTGILRGLGDSASALIYLLIATGINIVLDYVFVAHLGLGVAGVSLATVIAQVISALLALRKLMSMKSIFDMSLKNLFPDKRFFNMVIKLGLPSGVTQAIFSMSSIVVQSLTNSFGEQFIAANVMVMRVDGFVVLPAFSFGGALTTFAGQNIGAGKLDRVHKGAKEGTLIAVITSAIITVFIFFFGRQLMGIFTTTESLVALSYSMIKILLVGYIALEITQCLSGVMRGAGDTTTPMWISIINTVIIRVPLAYGLVYLTRSEELPLGDSSMIFVSLLLAWLIGAVITYIAYKRCGWEKKMGSIVK